LGRVIASQLSARIVFEPFFPEAVPDFASFHHYHFARPEEEDPELAGVVERIFTGKLRNPWTDKLTDRLRPDWRVVKDVRACLMLRWIHDHFPTVPVIFLIRHPCAVVASRTALRWPTDGDIKYFLQQPKLCADHLDQHMDLILSAETDDEKHAVIWCVTNLIPLVQFSDSPLTAVRYEDLAIDPRTQIPRIFDAIGQPFTNAVFEQVRTPSTTSTRHSSILRGGNLINSWKDRMGANAIDRVLKVVEQFGLSDLYAGTVSSMNSFPLRKAIS
jgi:hypothetical protein